jgi:hypothetical protein
MPGDGRAGGAGAGRLAAPQLCRPSQPGQHHERAPGRSAMQSRGCQPAPCNRARRRSCRGRDFSTVDLICNAQRRVSTRPSRAPASSRHVECTRSLKPIMPQPPRRGPTQNQEARNSERGKASTTGRGPLPDADEAARRCQVVTRDGPYARKREASASSQWPVPEVPARRRATWRVGTGPAQPPCKKPAVGDELDGPPNCTRLGEGTGGNLGMEHTMAHWHNGTSGRHNSTAPALAPAPHPALPPSTGPTAEPPGSLQLDRGAMRSSCRDPGIHHIRYDWDQAAGAFFVPG